MMLRLLPLLLCLALPAGAQPVPAPALAEAALGALPQHRATLRFGTPPAVHEFEGPSIWDALVAAGTVDPARHADAVRQFLRIEGADGYTVVVALAEIAPEFGDRPALLAHRMDGAPLPALRAVIPGERRAGRSVRDVARVTLEEVRTR